MIRLKLGMGLSSRLGDSVAPSGPTITTPGSIDISTFKIGTTQTVTAGTATASGGGTISYEYRHLSDGEVKSTSAAYAHIAADDGESGVAQWRAVETGGSNPGNTGWQTVASGTITYVAPANTVAPAVTGSTGLGDVLSVTQGTWTGSNITYSYQWQRDTVDISGATASAYMIVQADDAASLRCVVTATNSGGAVPANSNAVAVDDFAVPSITGVPTISGTESVGNTLTATPASVSGNPTPVRTWQWERSGAPISGATSSTYTLVAADETETLTVVQTETNALGVDTAESAATGTIGSGADVTPPVINSATFDGTDTIDMSVSEAGTCYYLVDDNATRTAAQVEAGGGLQSGSFSVSAPSDTDVVDFSSVAAGDHYLHLMVKDAAGNQSAVDSTQYTFPDGQAPTLSSATDAANGATASTGSVSTDEGNGTLYWVVTTSGTAPSAAQVKAGQDNTGTAADGDSGSQAVSATGTQNITPSGLTASTAYTTHFMHEDAASNQSAVVSASGFTTDAASAGIASVGTPVSATEGYNANNSNRDITVDVQSTSNIVVLRVAAETNSTPPTLGAVTLGGVAMDSHAIVNEQRTWSAIFTVQPTSTGNQTLSFNLSGSTWRCLHMRAEEFSGVDLTTPVEATDSSTNGSTATSLTTDLTTLTDGAKTLAIHTCQGGDNVMSVTTGTEDFANVVSGANAFSDLSCIGISADVATAGAQSLVSGINQAARPVGSMIALKPA